MKVRRKRRKTLESATRREAANLLEIENVLADRRGKAAERRAAQRRPATLNAFIKAGSRRRAPLNPSPETTMTGLPLQQLKARLKPRPPVKGTVKAAPVKAASGGRRKGAGKGRRTTVVVIRR